MLKELIKETDQQLSERAPKWRNLIYSKAGKAHRGKLLFDSQAAANAQVAYIRSDSNLCFGTLDGRIRNEDYAWHMQIPVMEGE